MQLEMCRDARPAIVGGRQVITWRELASHAPAEGPRRGHVPLIAHRRAETIARVWGLIARGVPFLPIDPRADAEAIARAYPPYEGEGALALVLTSGTTGQQRAAVLPRSAFAASAAASAENLGWEEGDRWLLALPLAHVGGLSIVVRTGLAGAAMVLPEEGPFTPEKVRVAVERDRATIVSLVPAMLAKLLDAAWDPPRHLRAILLGGDAAPAKLLARAADRGWPVLTTYGLTEACSQVATQRRGTVNRGELGAGPPIRGTEVEIAPDGEIRVRGPTLMRGYHPAGIDPFVEGGWLATGDLGRLDAAGNLHVEGRKKDLIVTGGEKVLPREVEEALLATGAVSAACAFGVPDEVWGEVVCAAVVAAQGARLDPGEIAARLPSAKRPRFVAFVESLPAGSSGKVDRRAARATAQEKLVPLRYPSAES